VNTHKYAKKYKVYWEISSHVWTACQCNNAHYGHNTENINDNITRLNIEHVFGTGKHPAIIGLFTDRISMGGNALTSVHPLFPFYRQKRLTADHELLHVSRS